MNTTTAQQGGTGALAAVSNAITNASTTYQALALGAIVLLLSRVFFGGAKKKRPITQLPFWVPLEIAAASYFVAAGGFMGRIFSLFRRHSGSLYGFTKTHQVLYDFEDIDKFLTKHNKNLDFFAPGFTLVLRVFGMEVGRTKNEIDDLSVTLNVVFNKLYDSVEKVFLNERAAEAAIVSADIPGKVADLVSFSTQREDQKMWEWCAGIKIIEPGIAVEASLLTLLRDLGACAAIPLLHGQDLLDHNPTFLEDFWKFDTDVFPMLVAGMPSWLPIRALQDGKAARDRCNRAVADVYRRVDLWAKGLPSGNEHEPGYIIRERNRVYDEHDVPLWARGFVDHSLLWGQNANTQAMVFWFVAYIYSTPDLLAELRRETADFVRVDTSSASNQPPRITSLNIPALSSKCPLLKSALYETFRLSAEGTSIRRLREDIVYEEDGKKYRLKGDSWISAPHGATQHEARYYPDPERFVPDRFLVTDAETGKRTARYGKLTVWGCGPRMCKGRTLAEKEILAIAASVMALWEMEPVGSEEWRLPGKRMGTGVQCPTEDMRVVLRRRTVF